MSGPLFTQYQEVLSNFESLCRTQHPRKPLKTRFCDLKRSNDESENRGIRGRFSSTALQRRDESRYAAYLKDSGKRAIVSENFSPIRSVLSFPLEHNKNKNEKKMKQTCASSYES